MKKLIFMGILGLFALGACNNKNTQGHEGHGHNTVTHNNDEHDHEAEGHDHEAEGHTHGTEGECNGDHKHDAADNHQGTAAGHDETAEAAHSDEIILPKAKADAAGVKVSIVEPAPFQQVIKTSGQVLAAQGDESVAVATVAGVVSFRGKVTEGMSVGSGTPLVTISSHNIADGDPVQRARIAYEVSKKEYERMKALVKNKIVSDKDFAQAEQNYDAAILRQRIRWIFRAPLMEGDGHADGDGLRDAVAARGETDALEAVDDEHSEDGGGFGTACFFCIFSIHMLNYV